MIKTILVTGGAGFIGSHVVDKLIAEKYNVVVIDNLIAGHREYVNKKAKFINCDIRDIEKVDKIFKKNNFYAVLHLAGQPSIVNSFTDPFSDMNTNFLGTMNMVILSAKHRIKRFLYASSMTVYGNQNILPIKETANCVPINYYGIAKYAAERFVHTTGDRNDLDHPFNTTSFRMFNVFGPRQSLTNPYQGVLAIFMGNVLRNEPITIFGDGKHSRDFVFVEDVAKIWVDSIDNKKSYGKVFNIGSGKMLSVNSLAKIVIESCGQKFKKYKINRKAERPGNQRFVEADISEAKKILNFKPETSFKNGLLKTLAWANKNS